MPITLQAHDHCRNTDAPRPPQKNPTIGSQCAQTVEWRKMGELQGSLGAIDNRNADVTSALGSTQQLSVLLLGSSAPL